MQINALAENISAFDNMHADSTVFNTRRLK